MISLQDFRQTSVLDNASPPDDDDDVPLADDLDFDITALDRRLVALALGDVQDVQDSRKGKRRVDADPTDEELAFALYAQELADRQAAYSLAAALDGDSDLLAQIEEEERMARRDRELALAAARGEPLPRTAPTSPARSPPKSPARSGAQTPVRSPLRSVFGARQPSATRTSIAQVLSPSSVNIHVDDAIDDKAGSSSRVECTACGSRIRGRSLRAPCSHPYDSGCIADLFQAAMTDESLFPPRCCQQEIPLAEVRALIPPDLLKRFEAKSAELRTMRRVYCPNASCSRFLGAQTDAPAWLVCPACATTACSACTAAHAPGVTCAQNADAQPILELAQEEGWQRCPGCRRYIELETGCYHMTCICRTQFCYVCAATWKTCQCPQWEENRLLAAARDRVAHEVGRRRFQPEAAPQRARIFEVAEQLRLDHDCNHQSTRYMRGSYQCQTCYWHADQFIFECTNCYTRICKRCKHNRM